MQQHRQAVNRGSKFWVHRAWRDFGEPKIEILGKYESQEDLNDAEIKAILEFNTLVPNGYNISTGGYNAPSKNPIVAKKISKLAKGRKHTKKTKDKLSRLLKERWKDPDYRENISKRLKKAWTPEMRAERSDWAKKMNEDRIKSGWKMPEEALKKMKGRTCSEETRRQMSESAKKRIRVPPSKKTRKKLSENAKAAWQNKSITEKRVKAIRAAWTPEKKAEFAKKVKQNYAEGKRKPKGKNNAVKKRLQQKKYLAEHKNGN